MQPADTLAERYRKCIHGRQGPIPSAIWADVYDVLSAFGVTCPARQHAIKKLLCAGERGHKDAATDLKEARLAVERAYEMCTLPEERT